MPPYLEWEENNRAFVPSIADLNRLLDTLTAQANNDIALSVELHRDQETSMYIVVGSDVSPVGFYSATHQPSIIGARNQDSGVDGYFEFSHRGHHSVVHQEYVVPASAAREALLYFYETGKQIESIYWD
jgi:hypothetical protein